MKTSLGADELAARIFEEQGFVVMVANHEPVTLGSIHVCDYYLGDSRTALRCIGPSTHSEFAKQVKRMNELSPDTFGSPRHSPGSRYFRMEPVD